MQAQSDTDTLLITGLDRLTTDNAGRFKTLITTHLTAAHKIVAVDCSQTRSVDSFGIGALVAIHRKLGNRNGQVQLRNLQPPVRGLLQLLKMDRIFELGGK